MFTWTYRTKSDNSFICHVSHHTIPDPDYYSD